MFLLGTKEIDRGAKPIDFCKNVLKDQNLYICYLSSSLVQTQNDGHLKVIGKWKTNVAKFNADNVAIIKQQYRHIKQSLKSIKFLIKCKRETKDKKTNLSFIAAQKRNCLSL